MSLILDALNRSRQDKDLVPNLATHHAVEKVTLGKRQYLPLLVFLGLAVIIGWLVIARLLSPVVADTEANAAGEQVPQQVVTTEDTSSAVVKDPVALEEPMADPAVKREVLAPVAVEPVALNMEPNTVSLEVALEKEMPSAAPAAENSAVVELYQNRDAVVQQRTSPAALALYADSINEQPIDIAQVLQSAREEMKDATLDEHPAPFLTALSQQTKDDIPTLYYQRHDYSNNTASSTVVLNSKTLTVGGTPVNGMRVEEILPDSVVLSYQGTQFRLRALNSWVNL